LAFSWLIEGLDCRKEIAFVPNPGNIGDAVINLACWRYLKSKFSHVEICTPKKLPTGEYVFVGGGGNFVEPLYRDTSSLVQRLESHQRIFIFPSTVYGHSQILKSIANRTRIICRENVSLQFVLNHMAAENVYLGHDAGFALAAWLRTKYADKITRGSKLNAKLFRSDRERALSEEGGLDIMGQHYSDWEDMALAESVTHLAAKYILGFGKIHTDRLHCAILAAVLGRETILYPNSYFKNAAVFEHSLSRISNVKFNANCAVNSSWENDPILFLRPHDTN
jgi:exopolysaccharide biosynthesis predicted pyruvyltransferase EpsI